MAFPATQLRIFGAASVHCNGKPPIARHFGKPGNRITIPSSPD